ncbi:MAG: 3-deoxy-8-phosphooctulonate synthase [Candidatus Eisenbacteria bacterium]|uniref:3-deoxy-8-phosphooctulonate synthase n=1 Tax=Eiseniibacteriota bacterium TaxID=2212470 RepID=A0A7Y2E7S6_UNCEI|nr:3-deoxy-8-phosphooctulonate synthase [Candidatus Eisenbacteria bacterium]
MNNFEFSLPKLPEHPVTVGNAVFGGGELALIAGPCVVEDKGLMLEVATELKRLTEERHLKMVFKASYAKDNRSSVDSSRGPGMSEGLEILADIKSKHDLPVLTDIHLPDQAARAAEVADVLQIPAFLCRQTSLLEAAGATGKAINIKKGQFMAPEDMGKAVEKVRRGGSNRVMLTERGTSFGYHNLVVDMRGFSFMAPTGCPLVHDITHSMQLPSSGVETGGTKELAVVVARAALAAGAHAVFFETHPDPDRAHSDKATQLPLSSIPVLLDELLKVHRAVWPT